MNDSNWQFKIDAECLNCNGEGYTINRRGQTRECGACGGTGHIEEEKK